MKKIALGMIFLSLFLSSPVIARADEADLMRKMDEILENQKQMMETLEHLKTELQIVKVRSTR